MGRFSAIERCPANPVQSLRQVVLDVVCSLALSIPQRVVGVQVSHDDGAVVGGQEVRIDEVLSLIGFTRSNGRPIDVGDVQGSGSEEMNSAHLCGVVCRGQLALCQRSKLEARLQDILNIYISTLRACRRRSSLGAPGDDHYLLLLRYATLLLTALCRTGTPV